MEGIDPPTPVCHIQLEIRNGIISRCGSGSQTVPNCSRPGSAGVEHAARNVDVRDSIAIEQDLAAAEIEQERKNGNAGGKPGQQGGFTVPAPDRLVLHSRWVSSRKI